MPTRNFMVSLVILAIAALIIFSLGGCGKREEPTVGPREGSPRVYVFIDAPSNCQYLVADAGGITPRLDKRGDHICES